MKGEGDTTVITGNSPKVLLEQWDYARLWP